MTGANLSPASACAPYALPIPRKGGRALGILLLAWLSTVLAENVVPTRVWRPILGTGFCGALTTFSAFQVETIQIARHDRPGLAAAYALGSIALGMLCAVAGTVYARRKRYG